MQSFFNKVQMEKSLTVNKTDLACFANVLLTLASISQHVLSVTDSIKL